MEFNHGLIKNATGYDFRHLFVGSEGTLGFVTEATMALCHPPQKSSVIILGVNELDSIMKVFSEFRQNMQISAFEMFSELALTKVIEQTQLPRAFSTTTNFYVLIEADSANEEAENQILKCFETCTDSGWAVDGAISQSDTQAKNFWRLREDISEATAKYTPYKNDISVSVSNAPGLMRDLDAVFNKAYPGWEVVWFGHVGDGNLHINILRPKNMEHEKFLTECKEVDKLVFSVVKNYKGAISAEHGVGLSKKNFLNYSRTEGEIALMKSIKKAFDPDNIINPGKIFDQSL
jgi:FAD/FMN-containing dehydrogenase